MGLPETIMSEIGLNVLPNSVGMQCQQLRQDAAGKLEAVINKHHQAGAAIVAANSKLMALAKEVAKNGEDSNHVLKKTWGVCYEIIQVHMEVSAYEDKNVRKLFFDRRAAEMRSFYLFNRRS